MPVNGTISDCSVFPAAADNRSQVTVTFLGFRPRTIVSLRSAFATRSTITKHPVNAVLHAIRRLSSH
jgi:hypothetical protein